MDDTWLKSLPFDDKAVVESKEGIRLSALLVSASAGHVKLLAGPLLLEFKAEDVIELEELMLPPEDRLSGAIAVDVVLRPGAPLVAIYTAEALPAGELGGPVPFSLATRPTALMLPPSPQYKIAETEYMQRYGLETGS